MEKIIKTIQIAIGVIGGVTANWLGGTDQLIISLYVFVMLDFATGIMKGLELGALDSTISFKGIARKLCIFVMIALSVQLETIIGGNIPLRDMTVTFYIANEGISVIENMSVFLPVPDFVKNVLAQLKDPKKQDIKKQKGI